VYKPNFCADCGSRIERSRWRVWTSRRFCGDCAPRFRKAQILSPLFVGTILFVVGLVIGRVARPAPPPLIVERGQLAELKAPPANESEPKADAETKTPAADKPEPNYGPDGTATERPTEPDEVVSICGARTQKGTPCQRRVRGTGRCWQHRGMPAIIPPEKRVIKGD
jgi:hypothetical protein